MSIEREKGHVEGQRVEGGPQIRRMEGGELSRRLVSRLLGLAAPSAPYRVAKVVWEEEHLYVDIDGPTPVTLVVGDRARLAGKKAFLESSNLLLWYSGDGPDPTLARALRHVVARWGETKFERLADAVAADPEVREEEGERTGETGSDPVETPTEYAERRDWKKIGTWDVPHPWADFFGNNEAGVFPAEPLEKATPFVRISHSDHECLCFMPREGPASLTWVEYPVVSELDAVAEVASPEDLQELTLSTDLRDKEVILGSLDKVREVLDAALADSDGRMILFENTCIPATIGEDVMSVVKKFKEQSPVPVMWQDRSREGDIPGLFRELLMDRRLSAEAAAGQPEANKINMIGFPPGEARDELAGLLRAAGLEVNVFLIPELEPALVDALPLAGLNVFNRSFESWDQFYEQVQEPSRTPSVYPTRPFGVSGMRLWLKDCLDAAGVGDRFSEVWGQAHAQMKDGWAEQVAMAAEHSITVVVQDMELDLLTDPGLSWGVPLVPLLREMGFGVEILIQAPEQRRELVRKELTATAALSEEAEGVQFFADFVGLRRLLSDSRSSGVVSNFNFDWRLSEAGKNRISLSDFRPGLSGALHTIERLVRCCRVPFSARYHEFLTRTPMGLRPAPESSGRRDDRVGGA